VAVAAWLWINYFTQDGAPATVSPAPAAPVPAVAAPPAVARELTIAQLPFLVTAAPEVAVEVVAPVEEVLIARPGDQRAAINPFSPIIVRAAPAPATPTPAVITTAPPPPIEIVGRSLEATIPLPIAPTLQPPPVVSAPVPRPLAPPPPVADNLPRALPSGTLPIAPSILRQARVAPPGPANLAEVVAIRVPEPTAQPPPGLTPEVQAAPATTPLRPLAPTPAALQITPPLSAGANPLARYLRDQNVTFTGSVLGPIGVGVFRSNLTLAPVVVALGQPLPNTDIVLKGLRGQEAVFSQGNHSETLVLNLRR